jgi:hypothetical protein
VPQGSIAWRQGIFWKYIPPPFTQDKPITLPKGRTPIGAKFTDLRTPEQTIQMIGESRARVPDRISVDKGVVDIFIKDGGKSIEFAGKGLTTNVGERIDDPAKGMSVPSARARGHAYARKVYPKHSVSRTAITEDTKEPVRGETSVSGINRPKIAEDTRAMVEGTYEEPELEREPVAVKTEPKEGYPELLATGYGKETYFDEDPEWLESLEPSILNTSKKPVNRVKIGKKKARRAENSPPTSVKAVRL